jgi:hypothetical protein
MDEKIGSDAFKEKMFGNKASKYQYQPIFRLPQEEDEDTKKEAKKDYGPKHPYMKLKIDTTYPDNQVKSIVFTSVMEGGKRVRSKVDGIKSIDDFASHVCWMSRIRPIVRPVKLWAQAANKKDPTYGLTFKIAKTEVEPPNKSNSNFKQFIESDAFVDSDNESESEIIETKTVSKQSVNQTVAPAKGKQVAQVDSESEQESEDESEDEEVVKSVTKSAASVSKASVKKVESEDEDEDDDEVVKPSKKAPTKATAVKAVAKSKKASA